MSKKSTRKNVTAATAVEFGEFVTVGLATYQGLGRNKGQRPQAALAFLSETTEDGWTVAVESWGAGFIRRAFREAAVFLEGKGREDEANVFWLLRDCIDLTGEVITELVDVEDAA